MPVACLNLNSVIETTKYPKETKKDVVGNSEAFICR